MSGLHQFESAQSKDASLPLLQPLYNHTSVTCCSTLAMKSVENDSATVVAQVESMHAITECQPSERVGHEQMEWSARLGSCLTIAGTELQ